MLLGHRAARLAVLLALSLTLGGCLTSHRPLFDDAAGMLPLGDSGRYETYEAVAGGFKRDETIEVRRKDNGYEFVDAKGTVTPVTLHPLPGGKFVAQIRGGGNDFGYALMAVDDDAVLVYSADCAKQDKARLEALGAEVGDKECKLDKVADPRALFLAVNFGEPTSKMVRIALQRPRR